MRKDASLLCVLLAIMLLSAITAPPEPIQNVDPSHAEATVKVADMTASDIEEAAVKKGWYKLGRNGLSYWGGDEASIDAVQKPPTEKFAAFVNQEMMESAAGLAVIALPFVLIIRAKQRKKRKADDRDMKRISGVSSAEFQAYMRKVNEIAELLPNIIPNGASASGKKNGGKKRWI